MKELHTETTQELRLWERLQDILTYTDQNKELVSRMLKDHKYVNAQFLQQLEDNANATISIVEVIRLRNKSKGG